MRILITGAAGFIGSHLMEAFEGTEVYGFDNFLTGRPENCPGVMDLDITNRHQLYELANAIEPDFVIHCAASYSDPDKWHRDTDTNVAGGINAALVAKHHGAHLIYFQTILPPISSYAISKIAAEQYMRMSGVPLTVFRLANIYGPRNLSGPIPVFYKRLSERLPCHVVNTTRDMLFIDDLVRCVVSVIEDRRVGTFDVCSGDQTTIMDLFRGVASEMRIYEEAPLVPPSEDDVQGTVSPENGVPGWKATTGLDDGIRKTVESYRQGGVSDTHTHLRLVKE